MPPTPYLTLLRGINVGGNNIIKMADLRACFEAMGFSEVRTYIQSGNVLFEATKKDLGKLTHQIEAALSKQFNYKAAVVVISQAQLKQVVDEAPKDFGKAPEQYRYDVLFIKPPLTATEALSQLSLREGVDTALPGTHAIYHSRLIAKAGQSYLTKVISLPIYKQMTIRNWNTTSKLMGMMENT